MKLVKIGEKNRTYFANLLGGPLLPGQGAIGLMEDMVYGAAAFSVWENTCYMDHIEVVKEERRKGYGSMLFEGAKKAMLANGIESFMTYYEASEEVSGFLRSKGFTEGKADVLYRLSFSDILRNEVYQTLSKKQGGGALPLNRLSSKEHMLLGNMIEDGGFSRDFLAEGSYSAKISFACIEGHRPRGMILAREEGTDVYVTLLLSERKEAALVMKLIFSWMNALSRKRPVSENIYFVDRTGKMGDDLGKILKDETLVMTQTQMMSAVLYL